MDSLDDISFISYQDNREAFNKVVLNSELSEIIRGNLFYSDIFSKYYDIYFDYPNPLHIVGISSGKPVIILLANQVKNSKTVGFYGNAAKIFFNCLPAQALPLVNALKRYINKNLCFATGEVLKLELDSLLLATFYGKKLNITQEHVAYIDLSLNLQLIKSNLRKSYKSLLTKGKELLETEIWDKSNICVDKINEMKEFHIMVSGRETRSSETWVEQFNHVRQGHSFVVKTTYQKRPSSYTLILTSSKSAYYGVGVYDRELMSNKIPLTHYPLWKSIEICKEEGIRYFILGDISSASSDKESNIDLFKRGFATHIQTRDIGKVSL